MSKIIADVRRAQELRKPTKVVRHKPNGSVAPSQRIVRPEPNGMLGISTKGGRPLHPTPRLLFQYQGRVSSLLCETVYAKLYMRKPSAVETSGGP